MNITLIAGSNRLGAASTSLLRYMETLLNDRQVTVALIDLRELPLPLFSPDMPELPPDVHRLLEAVTLADGLVIATPEYHGSISGVLKNALDYMNAGHVAGKPVLSVSSAGGPLGVSSLLQLQSIVRNLHGVNCPEWMSIGMGSGRFDAEGCPIDEGIRSRAESAVEQLLNLTRLLMASKATKAAFTA
ncbi:FMN-dependent NADPH-azoreductase [Paenibacillus solanacearum]|uniref:FMN-dependent NADPH-azoreductase n=1 Tax=Paenibacillus solanacearum TaxID=2048548 RepID=A0A916K5U9_9BACL|nr:NADPH-dependent FMN reductase [Paenibacillus solanacearum]CAG7643014.1 FMN-dependent NADPH-azoreductase [Paenibacillus solanacearum]